MKIRYITEQDKLSGITGITVFDCGHSVVNNLVLEHRAIGHLCVDCAVKSLAFSYARQRKDTIYLYKRDNGPSGVICFASGPAATVKELLRVNGRASALSPTER